MRAATAARIIGGAACLLGLALLGAAVPPAEARVALSEGFERFAPLGYSGPDGSAAYSRDELDFVVDTAVIEGTSVDLSGAVRGAISFDLQRRPGAPADWRGTILTLRDAPNEKRGFFLQVTWEMHEGRPMLHLRGPKFYTEGLGLWGDRLLLDRPVAEGQWIHVDLTWDDAARDYRLYVDGRPQDVQTYKTHPLTGGRLPEDPRVVANREGERHLAGPGFFSGPFANVLAGLDRVDYGLTTDRPERLTTALGNAVLDNLVIRVDEIPEPGFVTLAALPPTLTAVQHDARTVAGFSGALVAGNALGVTVRGEAGAAATFDVAYLPDLDRKVVLDWRGWGVYLEEKTSFGEDEVNLRDVREYRVYAATAPLGAVTAETAATRTLAVGEQSVVLEDFEPDVPAYAAVYAAMSDGTLRPVVGSREGLPLAEAEPGVYTGVFTVGYRDRLPRAVVVGHLVREGLTATLAGGPDSAFAADPALRIMVGTEPGELKADESSSAQVTVTVTDANGSAVSGHKVKFLLATTSQYTGVVGGGAFAQQVGGEIKTDAWGETDVFGKVTATYVAGFAAKTAVIVARDMTSNDTGAGWVKTYIQSTAQLELEPVEETAAAAAGYEIAVTSSDEWLTADGQSQARITAKVTLNGEPVEGHAVGFDVSAGTGSVRVVKGTTGSDGEARAVYTAGTKIGMVLVTATDLTVGISGSVSIELRSDAPAKLKIRIEPEKLPADGHSRADLLVLVTDINDNPNDNVEVEYRIGEGGGRLAQERTRTDQRGESENTYTAGRSPGRVAIEITVRSTVPTEEELVTARSLALAVTDFRFF